MESRFFVCQSLEWDRVKTNGKHILFEVHLEMDGVHSDMACSVKSLKSPLYTLDIILFNILINIVDDTQ